MEREKYYTPQIQEFCVGFECEVNWNKGYEDNFVSLIIDVKDENGTYINTLQEVIMAYDDGYAEFRVKYLDKEDIESLGFEYDKTILQEFYKEKDVYLKPKVYGYMIWKIRCQYRPDTHWFKLEALFETGEWDTLFEGKIKNKSELKRLMEMLEIC